MPSKVGPIIMGTLYLLVVIFIMIFCGLRSPDFNIYSQYWGLFGTLVGVATGAIPAFFFKAQADQATDQAKKSDTKARLYAEALEPDKVEEVKQKNAETFS